MKEIEDESFCLDGVSDTSVLAYSQHEEQYDGGRDVSEYIKNEMIALGDKWREFPHVLMRAATANTNCFNRLIEMS